MTAAKDLTLEQCVALKLMPDIRFFDTGSGMQAVQHLPAALAEGLAALQPGGVILFRENLASLQQCAALTAEIRQCLSPVALIAIDQEGGRVTRLPREQVTSFSGNMALAACPGQQRATLARAMGAAQGEELCALGINVNFAPTLDVNSNPRNPVINVRAFGDDPAVVASLGAQVVQGLQGAHVAAAVKHFPGHGDTSLDSHTHLPCVNRDAESARITDLAPFAEVIASAAPALVMTAHIQYPALDAEHLPGLPVVRPATLSRPIITDLLRERLGFTGVVISDALDMRAISELMTPLDAVLGCFRAGVDIVLMPLLLRNEDSLRQLQGIVAAVAQVARAGDLDADALRASADRVLALQADYAWQAQSAPPLDRVGCRANLDLEQRIAEHSITRIAGAPVTLLPGSALHVLMPDEVSAAALVRALQDREPGIRVTSQSLGDFDLNRERELIAGADTYLVGVSDAVLSAVDLGGAEDLADLPGQGPARVFHALLEETTVQQRILVMLGSPYGAADYAGLADTVLASYDAGPVGYNGSPGPAFQALAAVLTGAVEAVGQMPVNIPDP